jgi:hypothetical protein
MSKRERRKPDIERLSVGWVAYASSRGRMRFPKHKPRRKGPRPVSQLPRVDRERIHQRLQDLTPGRVAICSGVRVYKTTDGSRLLVTVPGTDSVRTHHTVGDAVQDVLRLRGTGT